MGIQIRIESDDSEILFLIKKINDNVLIEINDLDQDTMLTAEVSFEDLGKALKMLAKEVQ